MADLVTLPINDISQYQVETLSLLNQYKQQSALLCSLILEDDHLPLWLWAENSDDDIHARRLNACKIITDMEYHDGDEPSDTVILPGLIAASPSTIAAAKALNETKQAFKAHMSVLSKFQVQLPGQNMQLLSRYILVELGYSRLHKLKVYRQLVVLDTAPYSAGFFWSATHTVNKLTIDQAIAVVNRTNNDSPEAEHARNTLRSMPPHVMVAHKTSSPLHPRVNLSFLLNQHDNPSKQLDEKGRFQPKWKRYPKPASLPLLFLSNEEQLPSYTPLSTIATQSSRNTRLDRKLEEPAFLPEYNLYRYLSDLK